MHRIAENQDYGVEVYVTAGSKDKMPHIIVEMDEDQIYEESVKTALECEKVVAQVYDKYLTSKVIDVISEQDDDYKSVVRQEQIEDREYELDAAFYDLLVTVLEGYLDSTLMKDSDELCDDLKEHTLEYLYRKHGCSIRRPMYLEDEDGEEFFEEFPYECMIFDDEDNPLYKTEA